MDSSLHDLLKTCEREQLHLSGAIQANGALLHVGSDGTITHASANCLEQLGVAAEALLGRAETDVWNGVERVFRAGRDATEGDRAALYRERVGERADCDVALAKTRDGCLVEVYSGAATGGRRGPLHAVPQFYKLRKHGIEALCEQAVAAVQRETGFDKAMAYRFREDWSGEVVAEVCLDLALGQYLGQRFPASDIPKIARDLYVKNPSRQIADIASRPVPIIGRGPLDLTYSELRSVSPVHLEYLRNMGVGASCSFAIVIRGELWGLIACHDAGAKEIPLWSRNRCVEHVKDLAFAIATHETDQRMRFIDRIDSAIEALLDGIGAGSSLAALLEKRADRVLDLVGATGGAYIAGQRCVRFGVTPSEEHIRNIVELRAAEGLFATDHLAGVFPGYEALSPIASGVLAVHAPPRLRDAGDGPRFAWFRPEERSQIVWAGDPRKAVEFRDGAEVICPRTSFAQWTENMEGHSRRWTTQDLVAAQKFRTAVLRWAAH